jgi:two-component system response regulator MprA
VHLLIVEDDRRLGPLLVRMLSEDRHVVELAISGEEGLELAALQGLDAVILDVGLPDMSGFEVARQLRTRKSPVGILMLTARDSVRDRVDGLDAGADDYLVKPFAFEELAARLRALARRKASLSGGDNGVLRNGPISLDEVRRAVTVAGRSVSLSPREFSLLECLLRHPGAVLSRDQLLDAAWPFGVAVTPNTVDAYVHLLREKLGPEGAARIRTERGVGYRMPDA